MFNGFATSPHDSLRLQPYLVLHSVHLKLLWGRSPLLASDESSPSEPSSQNEISSGGKYQRSRAQGSSISSACDIGILPSYSPAEDCHLSNDNWTAAMNHWDSRRLQYTFWDFGRCSRLKMLRTWPVGNTCFRTAPCCGELFNI